MPQIRIKALKQLVEIVERFPWITVDRTCCKKTMTAIDMLDGCQPLKSTAEEMDEISVLSKRTAFLFEKNAVNGVTWTTSDNANIPSSSDGLPTFSLISELSDYCLCVSHMILVLVLY